jgi:hypothetical protein
MTFGNLTLTKMDSLENNIIKDTTLFRRQNTGYVCSLALTVKHKGAIKYPLSVKLNT